MLLLLTPTISAISTCEEPCAYASHRISRCNGLSRASAFTRSGRVSEECFLQKIIGELRVAGETDEISPHLSRGPFIKGAETFLVHPCRPGFRRLTFDRQRCLWHQSGDRHR